MFGSRIDDEARQGEVVVGRDAEHGAPVSWTVSSWCDGGHVCARGGSSCDNVR